MRGYAFVNGQSWYDVVMSDLEGDNGSSAAASKVH